MALAMSSEAAAQSYMQGRTVLPIEVYEGDTLQLKVYRAEGLLDLTANEDAPDGEYIDLEVTLAIVDTPVAEEDAPGMLYDQSK